MKLERRARGRCGASALRMAALAVAFLFLFGMTACRRGGKKPPSYLGAYNYEAQKAWLEPLHTEEGDFLEYREVKDLMAFATDTDLPIVLCVRQLNDGTAPLYIPQMETWAYDYRGKVLFLFADAGVDDPLVHALNFEHTPTFFLIQGGAVKYHASWSETQGMKVFEEMFKKEAEEIK